MHLSAPVPAVGFLTPLAKESLEGLNGSQVRGMDALSLLLTFPPSFFFPFFVSDRSGRQAGCRTSQREGSTV